MDYSSEGVIGYHSVKLYLERPGKSADWCRRFYCGEALRTIASCEKCRPPQFSGKEMAGRGVFYNGKETDRCWVLCVANPFICRRSSSSAIQSTRTLNISTLSSGWESFGLALRVCGG